MSNTKPIPKQPRIGVSAKRYAKLAVEADRREINIQDVAEEKFVKADKK